MAVVDMQKYSVQETEQASKSSVLMPIFYQWLLGMGQPNPTLPGWGNVAQLYQLRRLWYEQTNTLVAGALIALKNTVVQTPWQLYGPKSRTPFWKKMFQSVNKGKGFDVWVGQMCQDFLNLDSGAVSEIVGAGSPDKPLPKQRILGFNALDGLRCYHTGDPEFPIYYQSHLTNKLHKLHASRVILWVDSPSPDPAFRDLGYSAMSRAAGVAEVAMRLTQYQINALDDAPTKGILGIQGLAESFFQQSLSQYEASKIPGKIGTLDGVFPLFGADPANDLKMQYIKFSEMPAGETSETMLKNLGNLLALAIGVDPQDIFPLSSAALGSGAQSTVLAQKGKGKTYGLMLTQLERLINQCLLPDNMEFKWKEHDAEANQQEAQTAQVWTGIATSLLSSGVIDKPTAQKLLADNVEAFSDLLLDEQGQIRLPDNDPKDTEATADDATTLGTEPETSTGEKALGTTQEQFEAAIGDLFATAVAGQMKRQRFGIVARGLIASYGAKAYRDGLRDGGVDPGDISDEDLAEISRLAAEQSIYVTGVGTAIYKDETVSPAQAEGKPQLWWNKSIMPFYQAGLASADKNGMYEFLLGATEQHCKDCLRLNKQRHRLRDWIKRGLLPQSSNLECGGWKCDCRLEKTYQPALGSY